MTVSIIIPYYNHGGYLHAAVQSCLCDHVDVEVIIVNDGSKEAHAETYLAKAAALSPSVSVVTKPNGGLSSARNAGLDVARGDFIQFLDSDDVLVPGKLRLQSQQLDLYPEAMASVCGYILSNADLTELRRDGDSISPYALDLESVGYRWERGFSIPIHCGLFRRSAFSDLRFDEAVHGKEDWIFWSKLFSRFDRKIWYLPFVGSVYRQHDLGMTKFAGDMAESWYRATEIIEPEVSDRLPEFRAEALRWHEHFYRGRREELPTVCRRQASEAQPVLSRPVVDSTPDLEIYECIRSRSPELHPRISFVVPVYNHAKYLDKCLDSLSFAAVGLEYEVIVVDDCSPDGKVLEVLRNRKDDPRLSIYRGQINKGISVTQNAAVAFATGEYLAFVDCDDFLAPDALSVIAAAMRDDPSADYFFTDRIDIDTDGSEIRRAVYGGYHWIGPSGDIARDLLFGMIASHLKVIRKSSYLEAGGCDALFSGIQDWDLALRLARKARFSYIPVAVYNHRIHANSVTRAVSMSQFAQSNLLRSRLVAERFPRAADAPEVFVSWFDDIRMVFDLVDVIAQGYRLVFRQKCQLTREQLDILREFNGFFDRLEVTRDVAAQLMGYLGEAELRVTGSESAQSARHAAR